LLSSGVHQLSMYVWQDHEDGTRFLATRQARVNATAGGVLPSMYIVNRGGSGLFLLHKTQSPRGGLGPTPDFFTYVVKPEPD
jgi:hypothetical protein